MPNFNGPDGDLTQVFITERQMIDRYVTSGSLWSWGSGTAGELGDNTIVSKSSPVQTVSPTTNWKQVSNSVAPSAVKIDGTLWVWGNGAGGVIGNNSTLSRSSPVQTVAAGTNWQQVSASGSSAAGIKTDGSLWTWGLNNFGGLGNNSTASTSSPVQTISAGTNWKQISIGTYSAAIKTDGTLWTWGLNNLGQLGDNSTVNTSSPVQTASAGTDWETVVAGATNQTAAIKTDGTLWLWGANSVGQLGDNTTVNKSSPVQTIALGTNWKQVAIGAPGGATAAIKTDGTLWTWGSNIYGQLGDNTTVNKSSPVQTVSAGTNWKQVSCASHMAAIKTDGTLWLWGRNLAGNLGNSSTVNRSSPVQTAAGGTNWKQVSVSAEQTMAIYFYDAGDLYPSLG